MRICIWIVTTFVSNAKTILKLLEQKATNIYFLQFLSFVGWSLPLATAQALCKTREGQPYHLEKLKAFLKKSLKNSILFMNNIWSKIKKDSQYQQKEVQDWTSHLNHLQSILMEFGEKCALSKDLLIWYFYKALRPSIKLWIDEKRRELDGWEESIWGKWWHLVVGSKNRLHI